MLGSSVCKISKAEQNTQLYFECEKHFARAATEEAPTAKVYIHGRGYSSVYCESSFTQELPMWCIDLCSHSDLILHDGKRFGRFSEKRQTFVTITPFNHKSNLQIDEIFIPNGD